MDWLHRITITCFAASYFVAFAFEVSRVFFKASLRRYLIVGMTTAGLFAHTAYLVFQTGMEWETTGVWLGSWAGWCLAAAWVMAASYLWVSFSKSSTVIGLFLLPLVMVLIGIGSIADLQTPFSENEAKSLWFLIHGWALLLGTVIVALGFAFGIMYLYQAFRLKRKIPQSEGFRLPSLEWLERSSEQALIFSTILLAVGLISGLIINLLNSKSEVGAPVPWNDPVVWTSAILFAWLFAVSGFNLFYQPARRGRKVAYLIVASFVFLMLELGIVWWVGHGQPGPTPRALVSAGIIPLRGLTTLYVGGPWI